MKNSDLLAGCTALWMLNWRSSGGLTMSFQEKFGPIKVHVDNKGIVDAQCTGESKCTDTEGDLWIKI